ncbi:efflux transporter outer membrane subunit [Microbulbifer sp. CAU 1566]|uniref:efflux transporter outer membrane subunit n=1 Tax=Microbulbifer sp. CAU 1566 TaxID=2933269 RepID=UPI002002AE5D|nr:efflux transporter outer membrane subunit [Microbulbifer sp. CAU 1566]MCK7596981.1 efflux transporter outer membrane subunit [Microbulbifer sp. CAU 1566]
MLLDQNSFMAFSPKIIAVSGLLCALALAGCSGNPSLPQGLPADALGLPDHFRASGSLSLDQRWWQSFNDRELDQLVEQALSGNPDLQATYWRLQQADAAAAQARSGFWPRLTGSLENTEQRRHSSEGFDFSGAQNEGNSWSGSLAAGYEIDLWGRVRSGARAAEAGRLAQQDNFQVAALTLVAEVTGVWLQLQEQWGQLELLQQQLDTNRKTLKALELRFGAGVSAAADVLQQRQLVQQSLQELDQARANIEILQVQLAALLGRDRAQLPAFVDRGESLPSLPALPVTGVPADLLLRRPDVQRAQRELLQGHYLVDQAWAERLPSLSLSLFFSGGGTSLADIAEDWLLNLSAAVEGVIFDGGNLAAAERQQQAVEQERWMSLRNTVMQALSEVEQALINEQAVQERLQHLRVRADLAEQITLRQRRAYGQGTLDFLNVLSATDNQQSLERQLLTARRELLENRVTLYRAISGGLMADDLPQPPAVDLEIYRSPDASEELEK